ncbi:sigma 54 modulation/S30EA ribosomal C-terminal domain-containing protein [Cryptosporangium sp. NPDC048952]|uniref:sigma 54 modulation/S30EA ribosomal C-terminal domain-containing protein n=1 Tax=Cryptosporangium sp. NPDC048952 TaxID=3363961 RepID=UPI003720F1E3
MTETEVHEPTTVVEAPGFAVAVTLGGQLAPEIARYARTAIRTAVGDRRGPVLRADVRIVRYDDPSLDRPVASYATVNLNGTRIRVHTTAKTPHDGLDQLRHELRAAIDRSEEDRRADAHRRPVAADVPAAPRIRVPGVVSGECTVDEAIAVLDLLDRDFELFRDADSGEDTIVHRAGPTGYRLVQARRAPIDTCPAVAVSIEREPAPRLSVEVAAIRLARSEQPFVFFTDVATDRGTVLYVRRDGDYGMVTLA